MDFSYPTSEKLKSKKLIEQLFIEGRSVKSYPLRMVFIQNPYPDAPALVQAGVSVSKRNFKRAVSRNRIKRLVRESYRLHKNTIDTKGTAFAMLIIYTSREEISQPEISKAMVKLLKRFNDETAATTI